MEKKLDRAFYDVLGVMKGSGDAEIKKAYKKAALMAHPDKGGSDEMFQMVNEAYKVLGDPAARAEYDRDIKKFGLKDGQGQNTAKQFQRADSMNKAQKAERSNSAQKRQEAPSDAPRQPNHQSKPSIPDNIDKLTVKEIKTLLDGLGVKRDDCFEKEDLINRLKEVKAGSKKPPTGGASKANTRANTENVRQPSSQGEFHFDPSKYEMPKPQTCFLKIISVGNQESGKSCLIKRYCEGRFVKRYISTIGIDYGVKKLEIMNQKVCINFFDLSGNDEYKQIRTEFYKDACGVIMVFDVDNRDSYISLVQWEEEMKRYGIDSSRIKVVVCGNKCDNKNREVKEAEAQRWAKQRNWDYFETSASEGKNVTESFESLFSNCVQQHQKDKKTFNL